MKNDIGKIIEAFEKEIEGIKISPEKSETGKVRSIADGIATVSGLASCQMSEVLLFENGVRGLALNLSEDSIGVILFGDAELVKEGQKVERSGKILSIPVGHKFLGRVIDPLMNPVDGGSQIPAEAQYPVEKIAPGVMSREPVNVPMQTGVKVIDALVPVGRGQRELIIGDRQTGKTSLAIDSIINQKDEDVVCIYVAIGQKKANVARTVEILKKAGALDYTAVVLSSASDSPALLYLAPYVGCALGEYFMDQGKDVLIIYDDLSKHAAAYREISLLLRRPPGREAYPGDVFYVHSRLLERACRRNQDHGGGSMTALPIIETQLGDVSGYIPTNVISITDGQIFLESELFNKGIRPAINAGLSVSRVGGEAQIKAMKKNAGALKFALAQYKELESFAQFGSDLDAATEKTLERGRRITELMKQKQYSPVSAQKQVMATFAVNNGFLDAVPVDSINAWEAEFYQFLDSSHAKLLKKVKTGWDEKVEKEARSATEDFFKTWSDPSK